MVFPANVSIAPTLERMAEIYSLSRNGGRSSPRFAAYIGDVEHNWGLSAYNPMAGDAASAAVQSLLALDAERVAQNAAERAVELCEWTEPITLAIVAAAPGMWTDRLATEVRHRTDGDRRAGHGEILLWATDAQSVTTIEAESIAEAVRTMWTALHGSAQSLHGIFAREGLAYALGDAPPMPDVADANVRDAITVLGDTSTVGDIVAVLYGDKAAEALGYTALGIGEHAGFAYAIARARALVAHVGVAEALRAPPMRVIGED